MSVFSAAGQRLRRHPRISILTLAVVLAGAAVGGYFAVSSGDSTAAATPTSTTNYTVATGTIKQSVSSTGTLAPSDVDDLTFSSSGVITSVLVKEGQKVKKGQKLATINSAALAATVAQDKAQVANDEARVSDDETNDVSAAQLTADEAALAAAKNQLASDEKALAGATLTSPIAGVVASANYTVGQSVSGGSGSGGSGGSGGGSNSGQGGSNSSSSSSSPSGIEVISTNSWVVNATVDATSVDLINAGDQAQLTVSGATGTIYGTISSVAVLSSSSGGTASYPVTIAVTGSPTGLHDGASVTATLIYKQRSNVLVIPTTALHRNSAGTEYVNKVVNGKIVQTTVETGTSSGFEVEVTKGLSSGDVIQQTTFRRTATGNSNSTTGRNGGNFGGGNFGGGGGKFQPPTGGFGGAGGFGG